MKNTLVAFVLKSYGLCDFLKNLIKLFDQVIKAVVLPFFLVAFYGCQKQLSPFNPFPEKVSAESVPLGTVVRGGTRMNTVFHPQTKFNLLQVTRARHAILRQVAKPSTSGPHHNPAESLTTSVKDAIIAEPLVFPRPVWNMALKQFLKLRPNTRVKDSGKVLDSLHRAVGRDPSLKDHSKIFLQEKLLKSLRHVTDAEGKNVFQDHGEAVYIAVNKMLSETQSIDMGSDDLSIKITPKDLVKAYQFFCDEEYCQASLIKPAKLALSLPLSLNANVDIVFSRAYDPKKDDFLFEVVVDGTCHAVKLGNILSVDVSLGIDLEYYKKDKKLVVANPRCSLGISCDTPFLDFGAKVTNKGVSFDGAIDYPEQIPGWLSKMLPEEGEVHTNVPVGKIDDELLAMYRKVQGLPPRKESDPDTTWADLFAAVTVEHRKDPDTQ